MFPEYSIGVRVQLFESDAILQKGVENFIIEKLNDEETTGILAMDRLAFRVISKSKDLLNTKYLHYFLAIRKDIVHDLSLTAVP